MFVTVMRFVSTLQPCDQFLISVSSPAMTFGLTTVRKAHTLLQSYSCYNCRLNLNGLKWVISTMCNHGGLL